MNKRWVWNSIVNEGHDQDSETGIGDFLHSKGQDGRKGEATKEIRSGYDRSEEKIEESWIKKECRNVWWC